MTEDEDYVLKKDLSKMTLWDFYRTLPYPLPIKDELDEMSPEDQKPWLSLLVNRFENTEAYAKQQLDLPLNAIFANSEPRKKADPNAQGVKDGQSNLFRKTSATTMPLVESEPIEGPPHFDPVAYDKDSDIEYDEHDNEILIPQDLNDSKIKTTAHLSNNKSDIITEADNPKIN